jgi:epoxyqueuosine reductase
MVTKQELSEMITYKAKKIGFDACGIAKAEYLKEESAHLKSWLHNNMHGNMKYMENYFDRRVNPARLVKGAKSVIAVLLNYYTNKTQKDRSAPVISKYAYGKDYHLILKEKLYQLFDFLKSKMKNAGGRIFVDSAPVLERAWAAKAGLGWIGKNANLISPEHGSFVFIGLLITDVELYYGNQIKEMCGDCEKCISSCPTRAIVDPRVIDARKCISYLTVEHKDAIPEKFRDNFSNNVFGCDICQNVCPWNINAGNHRTIDMEPLPGLLEMSRNDWYNLSENTFRELFGNTVVERTGFSGLKRNIEFVRR